MREEKKREEVPEKFEEKKRLRREVLTLRHAMTTEEILERSSVICEKILGMREVAAAKEICLYMPINNEVDVSLMVERLRSIGKKLYLPRVNGHNMHFFAYESNTRLAPGGFGILEPWDSEQLVAGEDTLIIMPGAVFSEDCDRVGYGGGYYDRYLKKHPEAKTIAVAYAFQVQKSIPVNEQDVRPESLITETAEYHRPYS